MPCFSVCAPPLHVTIRKASVTVDFGRLDCLGADTYERNRIPAQVQASCQKPRFKQKTVVAGGAVAKPTFSKNVRRCVQWQPGRPCFRWWSNEKKKVVEKRDNASRSPHMHCRIPVRLPSFSTSRLKDVETIPLSIHEANPANAEHGAS